jgi:hypothetical protein
MALDVVRVKTLGAILERKIYGLPGAKSLELLVRRDCGIVDKDIIAPIRVIDKTISFFGVKPFNDASMGTHHDASSCDTDYVWHAGVW